MLKASVNAVGDKENDCREQERHANKNQECDNSIVVWFVCHIINEEKYHYHDNDQHCGHLRQDDDRHSPQRAPQAVTEELVVSDIQKDHEECELGISTPVTDEAQEE